MTILGKKRVTLFLNPELIKQAKAEAIVEELSLTALIEKALIQYLPRETIIKKTHIVLGTI
jgi:predicted HicB family RNase H-like nuclease